MSLGEEGGVDTTLADPGYILIDRFAHGDVDPSIYEFDYYTVTLEPGTYFFWIGGSSFMSAYEAEDFLVGIFDSAGNFLDSFSGGETAYTSFTVYRTETFLWEVTAGLSGGYAASVSFYSGWTDDVDGDFGATPAPGVTYWRQLEVVSDVDTYDVSLDGGIRYFWSVYSRDISDLFISVENYAYESLFFSDVGRAISDFYTPVRDVTLFLTVSSNGLLDTGSYSLFYQETLTSSLPVKIGTPYSDALSATRASELWGWDGSDALRGSVGSDYLLGGRGNDQLWGYARNDVQSGDAGNDRLWGGSGDDRLSGGTGHDRLSGDAGRDVLAGGSGLDVFVFRSATETAPGRLCDVIRDFTRGTDMIDLAAIDANAGRAGNQAFKFVGTAAFSDTAGELRCKTGILSGDVNGDGVADFQIALTDVPRLAAGDMVL